MIVQIRFAGEAWERSPYRTEQEAADHWAGLCGSTCPVPGAYVGGTRPARAIGPGRWVMPTGARVETRTVEQ